MSGAALLADSSCTRDERRERIVLECNNVRQALQVSRDCLESNMYFCGNDVHDHDTQIHEFNMMIMTALTIE